MRGPETGNVAYAAACDALYRLSPLGVQLGTERIAAVLERLGDPQRRYPALHIAGTNGKGSTAALCVALLREAGRRCGQAPRLGLYTSPHLLRLTERIQVSDDNGVLRECSRGDFAALIDEVQAAAARPTAVALTFFEVLTAAAFVYFARRGVTLAVIETGLGGRLDATRLCAPVATAVTSIGYDHTELLGPTLARIAVEKGGIFKAGVPAYVSCTDPAALASLLECAAAVGAPRWAYPTKAARDLAIEKPDMHLLDELPAELGAALALAGAHQRSNAALALALAKNAPGALGAAVAASAAAGLAGARWPGRLEVLRAGTGDAPEVLCDAAHNGEGAAALADWLAAQPRRRAVLFGVVQGKRAEDMLGPLRHAESLILCRPPSPRGREPTELLPLVAGLPQVHCVAGPVAEALALAERCTPVGGQLVVYGSIFLLAEVRRLLLGEPADSDVSTAPTQDPLR